MVHRLGQNWAEGNGGERAGLFPHSSDLQQGSEGWLEKRRHGNIVCSSLITLVNMTAFKKKEALTQPADGTVVGLVAQRVGTRVAEAQMPAGEDEGVSQVRQTHNTLVAVVAVLVIRGLDEG